MDWREEYKRKTVSFTDAARQVRSGDFVGIGLGIGACSPAMYDSILDRGQELTDVTISDTVTLRPSRLYDLEFMLKLDGRINYHPSYGMALTRKIIESRLADFYPEQGHDLGDRYSRWSDVYIAMVGPPNDKGFLNLGLTNFYTMEAVRLGKKHGKLRVAIAEVNDQMPVILGNNWMHISEFDFFVENSTKIPIFGRTAPGETEKIIGQHVLELINDGDTLQMGLGAIPEAVIAGLESKHDLGVHSEMYPTALPRLFEKGIVTNNRKPLHPGVSTATVCIGDEGMYDYVHQNPVCQFYPASYINNPAIIAQHPNFVAMNMALMVDLSGQIASEGLGHRMISGSGGQLDFTIGAYHSKGGKGIILIYSARQLKDGSLVSSIVPEMPPGTPITVPRTYAHYVVTEYGVADLRYKSRRQRAEALINIAHPDLRGELRDSLKKNFYPSGNFARPSTHAA
jgi:4-hydroxybutyrate CoA-transferase